MHGILLLWILAGEAMFIYVFIYLFVCPSHFMVIEVVGQTALVMAGPKGDGRVEGLANESCADVNLRISRDFSAHQKKSTFLRFFRAGKKIDFFAIILTFEFFYALMIFFGF